MLQSETAASGLLCFRCWGGLCECLQQVACLSAGRHAMLVNWPQWHCWFMHNGRHYILTVAVLQCMQTTVQTWP